MKTYNGISSTARGAARRFRVAVDQSGRALDSIVSSDLAVNLAREVGCRKSSIGRERAARRYARLIPMAQREMKYPDLVFSFLRSAPPTIANPGDPGETQSGVTIDYLVVAPQPGRGGSERGMWTLEISDHALGRLCERAGIYNPTSFIFAAHRAILEADIDPLPLPQEELLLPNGSGSFLGNLITGACVRTGNPIIFFRARTWLHEDMGYSNCRVLSAGSKPLGSGPLIPTPLRSVTIIDNNLFVEPLGRYAKMMEKRA